MRHEGESKFVRAREGEWVQELERGTIHCVLHCYTASFALPQVGVGIPGDVPFPGMDDRRATPLITSEGIADEGYHKDNVGVTAERSGV